MAVLRLFAAAREAAGVARVDLEGPTVADVLDQARARYGEGFSAVVAVSRVWVNGQPAEGTTAIGSHDVVAVLPPVSGGSGSEANGGPRGGRPRGGGPVDGGRSAPSSSASSGGPTAGSAATTTSLLSRLDGDLSWSRRQLVPVPRPLPPLRLPPRAARAVAATRALPAPLRAAPGVPPLSLIPTPEPLRAAALAPSPTVPRPDVRPPAGPDVRQPAVPHFRQPAVVVIPADGDKARPNAPGPPMETGGRFDPGPGVLAAAAAPAVAPARRAVKHARPPLAVVQNSDLPHGRRGVVWAAVTVGAIVAGGAWLAVWLGMMAFVAASQTAAVWRGRGERPMPLVAAGTAAGITVAAAFGVRSVTTVTVLAVVAALSTRLLAQSPAPARDVALTLALGVPLGLAAGSLVLLRAIDVQAPLLLLAYAAVYDAGAYLVGTGASSAWEGPAAGVAALIPLTLLASLVLVPPFKGVAPLLLGLIGAACAPLGPLAGSALLGDGTAERAPALRRLDSLLVMGPLWAWCAAAFLHG